VKKLTEKQLQHEAEKLIREGRMPSLETLCTAVLEARKKYANQIRRARREARKEVVVQ
jgi:vacuolar-type H+-ATPase subunit H